MIDYEEKNYRIVIFVGIICVIFFLIILIGTLLTNGKQNDNKIDTHNIDYVVDNLECSYSSDLAAISNGEKIGFIDRNKKFVIDYMYDYPVYNDYCTIHTMFYNFYGNYAIVYKDGKYNVIDKSNVLVNTFDDVYMDLDVWNNSSSKCVYVLYNNKIYLYCINNNRIIDVPLNNVVLGDNGINIINNDNYINGNYFFYSDNGKKYCYNLETDSNFEIIDYNIKFYPKKDYILRSSSTLFIKYNDQILSAKDNNYNDLFTISTSQKYDDVFYLPSDISSGKYYFVVVIGDKFGVIDNNGNEIVKLDNDINNNISVEIDNNKIIIKNNNGSVVYDNNGKILEE